MLKAVIFAGLAVAPSPLSVNRAVAVDGAKKVVDALSRSGEWEKVIDGIAGGSVAWIKLVPALADGTDAATSEELGTALIYALPKSSSAVLAVIDLSGRSVPRAPGSVCSASFYEGDTTNVPQYLKRAVRAVSAVRIPSLSEAKRACLAQLRKAH